MLTRLRRQAVFAAALFGGLALASPGQASGIAGPSSAALANCVGKVNAAYPGWGTANPSADQSAAWSTPKRFAALSKGVNYTDSFEPAVSASRQKQDFAQMRQLGLRYIRLPIDPASILAWPTQETPDARLNRLDETMCLAVSAGLAVLLVVQPQDPLVLKDTGRPEALGNLSAIWDHLAARYAVFPPVSVMFEALNEPTLTDGSRWEAAQRTLLEHIRRQAPHHTVLLTATPDSTAGALAGLTPVDDPEVAYVFHFYSPMSFTHQGADWSSAELGSIKRLDYPAEPGNVAAVRSRAIAAADRSLSNFLKDYSTAKGIEGEIDVAARWAAKNHVHLVVTEFGVYKSVAPPDSRAAWLRDVRRALEARSIGWAVWEYRGGFGIDADLARACDTEASIRSALGLCRTGHPVTKDHG